MSAKIYYIPGSAPCNAVFKAADLKGIDYKKVVVLPPVHRLQMILMFGGRTVPAMKLADASEAVEKVQGSRAIIRTLDSLKPEPPLFPGDPDQRGRVTAAETWADGDFQDIGRRLIWAHLTRSPDSMLSYGANDRMPLPAFMLKAGAKPVAWVQSKLNNADDASVKADLAKLPDLLDQVDRYIADGVIGGEAPNAADLQICSSLALLLTMDDLRPAIEDRPCGELTARLFPPGSGRIEGDVLPADWLAPLRGEEPVAV
ncbi:MAG: glutathione S-transferase N-terminal domain-containing protein [Solirubrobacterales bacterium]